MRLSCIAPPQQAGAVAQSIAAAAGAVCAVPIAGTRIAPCAISTEVEKEVW